ncbi:MAG: response regulator, partial [candidate division Zixibacteria bacterium]
MKAKILLADDDAGLRRVIQYKLQQGGHDVVAVADGQSALGLVRSQDFDVLITDLKMPGLNGIELLEKVRALRPTLEVILITAFAEVSAAVRAIKLG